ncbi:hypothetical protein HanRHA438_Chr05g0229391 [Helianthus annuus]|nr:hypothetical protein HanIR_Chr09g0420511 [Helianthus annuus]KAJ0919415.1 hypothetical protein HanRHA438_Chr05g0229391 [Helianthus annuus]
MLPWRLKEYFKGQYPIEDAKPTLSHHHWFQNCLMPSSFTVFIHEGRYIPSLFSQLERPSLSMFEDCRSFAGETLLLSIVGIPFF